MILKGINLNLDEVFHQKIMVSDLSPGLQKLARAMKKNLKYGDLILFEPPPYKPEKSNIEELGGVSLLTQEEMLAFPAMLAFYAKYFMRVLFKSDCF